MSYDTIDSDVEECLAYFIVNVVSSCNVYTDAIAFFQWKIFWWKMKQCCIAVKNPYFGILMNIFSFSLFYDFLTIQILHLDIFA